MPASNERQSTATLQLILLAALAPIGGTGCQRIAHAAPAPAEESVAVQLARVDHGALERPIRATGLVQADTELDLGFEAPGKVVAVLVEEGAMVKKGQVLARLDATLAHASRASAAEAKAKAERDLTRFSKLEAAGSVPEATKLDAQTGAMVARASLDAATRAEAQMVLVAPESGRIERRTLEVGNVVGAGQPVFRLGTSGGSSIVKVALADRDVLAVTKGALAWVTLDARPGDRLPATIRKVAPAATPATGTFAVEIAVPTLPSTTLTGLSAKVEIARTERPRANVPVTALVDGAGDRAAVFVAASGKAHRIPVTVLFLTGDRAALAEPLDGIESVIAEGAALVSEGRAIHANTAISAIHATNDKGEAGAAR